MGSEARVVGLRFSPEGAHRVPFRDERLEPIELDEGKNRLTVGIGCSAIAILNDLAAQIDRTHVLTVVPGERNQPIAQRGPELGLGGEPHHVAVQDRVERPFDGPVEGDGSTSCQVLNVDGHIGQYEHPIIETPVRNEEHVIEGGPPGQPFVTQNRRKLN